MVKIPPEWVTGPEQGTSSGRIATFSLWTGILKYVRRTAGYTWDRLQNKHTDCEGFKNNINFGQITVIQEKLDTTCK